MRLLNRFRVFKRLRDQKERIEHLTRQVKELNAPVFFTKDSGGIRLPLFTWNQGWYNSKRITLEEKLELARELCQENPKSFLNSFSLALVTNQGLFCKFATDGEQEIDLTGQVLVAEFKWPPIEVGRRLVIYQGFIYYDGKVIADIDSLHNVSLTPGDILNIVYTFNSP